jgi:beta-N-acetylhexosaminidase
VITGLCLPAVMIADRVKREIGQHFVLGFHGQTVSDDIKRLIQDYYVGNIILMKRYGA